MIRSSKAKKIREYLTIDRLDFYLNKNKMTVRALAKMLHVNPGMIEKIIKERNFEKVAG